MERTDRRLQARFTRNFMRAVEENMGSYCLHMMLRQANLERYITPSTSLAVEKILASEFAAFQKAIRDYYGTGARGSLIRIGQRSLDLIMNEDAFIQKIRFLFFRLLPAEMRRKRLLEYLAGVIQQPGTIRSLFTLDKELIFVDATSDTTYQQSSSAPICWATVGMIHRAIVLSTGEEADIVEINCRAMGDEACKFRISQPPFS